MEAFKGRGRRSRCEGGEEEEESGPLLTCLLVGSGSKSSGLGAEGMKRIGWGIRSEGLSMKSIKEKVLLSCFELLLEVEANTYGGPAVMFAFIVAMLGPRVALAGRFQVGHSCRGGRLPPS